VQSNPVFAAVVQATEEAIVNAIIAADSMAGIDNHHVTSLSHDQLRAVLKKYNRLIEKHE
jgi:L-aminopeptidase/D-esterase-like protein